MSDSIGRVQLDLETNYGPFQQQLGQIAGKSTNMVTAAFSKLGKVAAGAFAVGKLIQFGKASINLASDLQEVQNVVDVVFGKSANQINNFAKTALTQYGLSELSAKRYASTMGAMLKSMGLSEKATLDMSQAITGLAGDMASFYNLDSDEAFAKIRAGISGETEPLKQLGINMSVANLEAYALSQGITKSYQSMTQAEQALLRYNYLLSTTSDAQGDFARTSNSWANQTRILTEQLNSLKATLGSAFIAVLTPVVRMLNWVISKIQIAAAYFKAFVELLTGVKAESNSVSAGVSSIGSSAADAGSLATGAADSAGKAAKKAKGALAGFDKLNVLPSSSSGGSGGGGGGAGGGGGGIDLGSFSGLGTALPEPDTSGVEAVINKIKGMFASLRDFILTAFAPTIESWGNAFSNLKQPIADAFINVGASLQGLWENTLAPFGEYLLSDFIPNIVNSFSETFAPIFTDVMSFAIGEFAKDFEFVCQQISSLVNDVVKPALELLKKVFVDVMGIVKTEWDKSGKKLLTLFGKFRDSIKEIWNNLYGNIIKPVWDAIVQGVDELWDKHLKPAVSKVVEFFSKFAEAVMTVWNNALAPLINWLVKTFGPLIVDVFNTAWGSIKKVFGNLIDGIKNIFSALGGLMDFITGVFSGNWKKAWNGIKSFFKGIWDSLVNVIKAPLNIIIGAINTLLRGITSAVNLAIKGLNKLSFTVPSWVPVIGGKKWGFDIKQLTAPSIPYLARGGIIDQPTLAMVGERGKEAVVPLENTAFADSIANAILRVLAPLFANGNSLSKNGDDATVIVLKIGEYELGRVTVGAINKYHNTVGKIELEV